MPVEAGRTLAHYRLVERIGEGGMGIVWRAYDTRLSREVALKTLPEALARDPERLARLDAEARAIASLSHPNIVTLFSLEEAEGSRFLTMELVSGRSLAELIPRDGLPLRRACEIALPVLDAIAAAHRHGITHRDLKPGNIMLDHQGRVKVLDFGLAALPAVEADAQLSGRATLPMSPERRLAGTLAYMSPEQLRGGEADPRSDVYSFGVVLFEMTAGRRPFEAKAPVDLIASILREPAPPVTRLRPELPAELDRLLLRCLHKDPERRPQSAEELHRELERLARTAGQSSAERSIAVLPFADLSRERDQEYFCDGVAEEILLALRSIPGLRVASRAASFRFRSGSAADAAEAGGRLGVSTLLDGSVRKSQGRVRIAVELIDVRDGFQIWAERYDGELGDIFALQDEIARKVAAALQLTLAGAAPEALHDAGTTQLDAYDVYLRGRKLYYQYSRSGVEQALELFTQAIARDESFARAYAGIADCCCYLYLNAARDAAILARGRGASQRALALAAELPEAHASYATVLSIDGRHAEAEREFAEASRLDPDLFEAHYFRARDAFARGALSDALHSYEEAMRVRPDDYQSPLLAAQVYDDLGRPADAAAARREGVRCAERQLQADPRDVRALYMGANGLVALGERARGLEWADRALALESEEPMLLYNVACIHALAGERERALEGLERCIALGFTHRRWLEHDNNLDSIRQEPRFQALVKGLP